MLLIKLFRFVLKTVIFEEKLVSQTQSVLKSVVFEDKPHTTKLVQLLDSSTETRQPQGRDGENCRERIYPSGSAEGGARRRQVPRQRDAGNAGRVEVSGANGVSRQAPARPGGDV